MGKTINIEGQKFGRLTALQFLEKRNNHYYWLCKCECGNETIVEKGNLVSSKIKSCGCLKKETDRNFKKHGKSYSKLYRVYKTMVNRCCRENHISYKLYGARGIKVCDEWQSDFMIFYDWAAQNGYKEGLSIDRIDVNGNYEPSNCRWVDRITQANNTRRNHFITYNNQTHTLAEWSRILNCPYETLKGRVKKGYQIEQIFNTSSNKK